jgi:predicted RNA-binding Zn ribbon-like protein
MNAPQPLRFAVEPPTGVQLLMDFVNTRPIGARPDMFGEAELASGYLRNCGLDVDLGERELRRVRKLRDALVEALGTDPDDGDAWRTINGLAANTPLKVRFEPGPTSTLSSEDQVVGRIMADMGAAIAADRWTRLHLCANAECRVAFYDASRSRTQRWHSYEICGNRANVAAHRARTYSP